MNTITDEKALEIVEKKWRKIAAQAWEGYLQYGRGSIYLLLLEPEIPDIANSNVYSSYIPQEDHVKEVNLEADLELALLYNLQNYDPKISIVVTICNPATGEIWFSSLCFPQSSPPKAYESIKHELKNMSGDYNLASKIAALEILKKYKQGK